MEQDKDRLLLAFYGDDFTGSTDALEFLSRAGIKTILFIAAPTPGQLKSFEGIQAIGVAGMTRAMRPPEMQTVLQEAFSNVEALKPLHVHYKVCSTFDSSPEIGSIGKAIDTGAEIFGTTMVPLLVAAPKLGRYCLFGNLFARMGIGSNGNIYRLDRHPSMSKHPTTPATESDLRLHLAKQTSKKIALMDILEMETDKESRLKQLANRIDEGAEILLLDAMNEQHMQHAGEVIDSLTSEKTLFSVGSSGIEMALGHQWNSNNISSPQQEWPKAGAVETLLVASGSCSPVTSAQIAHALEAGFAEIAVDTYILASSVHSEELLANYAHQAIALLKENKSVIIHTSSGPGDIRMAESAKLFKTTQKQSTAELYGTALGLMVKTILEEIRLQRVVIAGGDTSSFAARALGIAAVEMIAPLAPGAPLCKAYAPDSPANGIEINFKGGQVGKPDYFSQVRSGNPS
jgi:uncharacterized protein YgbK (DUF1537 family)